MLTIISRRKWKRGHRGGRGRTIFLIKRTRGRVKMERMRGRVLSRGRGRGLRVRWIVRWNSKIQVSMHRCRKCKTRWVRRIITGSLKAIYQSQISRSTKAAAIQTCSLKSCLSSVRCPSCFTSRQTPSSYTSTSFLPMVGKYLPLSSALLIKSAWSRWTRPTLTQTRQIILKVNIQVSQKLTDRGPSSRPTPSSSSPAASIRLTGCVIACGLKE